MIAHQLTFFKSLLGDMPAAGFTQLWLVVLLKQKYVCVHECVNTYLYVCAYVCTHTHTHARTN